jgi:hypothetical protein
MFPYRLLDPNLHFDLADINGYIYTGEVPPLTMYLLLTTKWEVEPNVALALINLYGGHIYDIEEALYRMESDKEEFHQFFDSTLNDNIRKCLKWKGEEEEDNIRMRETLRQLAVTGFVPLDDIDDPIAKIISINNVGGIVKAVGTNIGISPKVWQQTNFKNGIVPTKQSMRLVIAQMLEK